MRSKSGAFPPKVRDLIETRDQGMCAIRVAGECKPHGDWLGLQAHHRAPRQQGGSRLAWIGQAANGLLLCASCHMWVEMNRRAAEDHGWIIRRGVLKADEIPVTHALYGRVLLNDRGTCIRHDERG